MGENSSFLSKADAFKASANKAFSERHYINAEASYTSAVETLEAGDLEDDEIKKALAINLSNRSFTRLKLEEYGWAIEDATRSININPSYVKAYYRRGSAKLSLGKNKEALQDFRYVAKIHPNDKDARLKLKECEKIVKQEAFALAIQADEPKSILDTLDLEAMVVEDTYTGPRYPEDGVFTKGHVEELIEHLRNQKPVHKKYAFRLLIAAKKVFEAMENIVTLPVGSGSIITVCGDTHGQYYDLLNIFKLNGMPSSENPYLFNGDFVDRGSFSVEVILTLLALKIHDPNCMHLTRGNHESESMNKIYGFEGEVKAKHGERLFKSFSELFRTMPLAYILDGTPVSGGKRALVLHGGLFSRDGVMLEDLQKLDRFREPDTGLMAEMLWSDPRKENGWGTSKRGIGASFGPDVTKRFLDANNLELVVRSHELKDEGYEIEADGRLITVFSAPNYCDQMGNSGAYIRFKSDMKPNISQFKAVPHPDVKPMAYVANAGLMGLG
ncbi:hypothetical protein NDN08_001317 [Rhodosorus marinus]|uniref:protein-serine/threonine phosphatase n=1 Tax=Rhodosorus marinus TaxID=101924 RepID=A0AAV8UU52_9RHOD|nr:hypothetical protein NDN08_001317 [Rhodosorus marinus]